MRLACSTSAFAPPLESAVAAVAELGLAAIDLIAIEGWGHLEPEEVAADWEGAAERVEVLLRRHRLAPVALNVAVGPLYERGEEAIVRRRRLVEALVRLMSRLGIEVASLYPGYKVEDRPWSAVLAATVPTVQELLAIARAAGVTLTLEPHFDTPFQTVAQVRRLLEAVPELGIAYDPSHFAMQDIPLSETAFMLERAAHVHLRDAAPGAMQVEFGRGTVDLPWLLDALRERGYRGHLSIEYLRGDAFDVVASVRQMAETVAGLLG